eukprot:183519_1
MRETIESLKSTIGDKDEIINDLLAKQAQNSGGISILDKKAIIQNVDNIFPTPVNSNEELVQDLTMKVRELKLKMKQMITNDKHRTSMSDLHCTMFKKLLDAEDDFEDKIDQLEEELEMFRKDRKNVLQLFGVSIQTLIPRKLNNKALFIYRILFDGYCRNSVYVMIPAQLVQLISFYYPIFWAHKKVKKK